MHVGAVILLFLFASSGAERALPSEIDLRAAYCIPVVQNSIKVTKSFIDADAEQSSTKSSKILEDTLAEHTEYLRRLQLYLLPRISHLEPLGLETAMQRAKEDLAKSEQHGKSCQTKCKASAKQSFSKEIDCIQKCAQAHPLWPRLSVCSDHLRWLPY